MSDQPRAQQLRTCILYVTSGVFSQLRAWAELHRLDSADAAAVSLLQERFATDEALQWLARERRKAMDKLHEEYAAKWGGAQQEDNIVL